DHAAEHLKGGYLYDDSEGTSEARRNLNQTRLKLAEISAKSRRGRLFDVGKKRSSRKLAEAEAAYDQARQTFLEEEITEFGRAHQAGQKEAYLSALSAHEDGALMATEANYYMSKENSKLQKSLEWYKGLSKKERIIYGIGASAAVGALAGVALGAAAGGAIIGTRVGKGYLNREARRAKDVEVTDGEIEQAIGDRRFVDDEQKDLIYKRTKKDLQKRKLQTSKFEKSTLRLSNQTQHDELLDKLNDYKKPTKQTLLSAVRRDAEARRQTEAETYKSAISEAEAESKAKRKSLYTSVGFAALGGAIGAAAEYLPAPNWEWHGWTRGGFGEQQPSGVDSKLQHLQEEIADKQQEIDAKEHQLDAIQDKNEHLQDKLQDLKEAAQITDRSDYLYGEFAGQHMDITIPEGSNVWDQLESQVHDQYPHASYNERERMVGNLLNSLKDKYPNRNFNIVQPGDHFSFTPNPKA
ncbi:MAG TPA: hypothetical protein VFK03_04085, partial [Candidatus Saccharimonadales bacterium]|nr:hypothetical protein [Candidatus Saccharimonadales bacterium]